MNANPIVLSRVAAQVTNRAISNGAQTYSREVHLPRLFILDKDCLTWDKTKIIAKLENMLRGAKEAVRKGHWTADGNRVMALRQALHAELGYGRGE